MPARPPGVAIALHLGRRAPVVGAPGRHLGQAAGHAVGRNRAIAVHAADQLDTAAHPAVGVVQAELEPVDHVRVSAQMPGRHDVLPLGIAVAVPRFAQRLEVAIPAPQPGPEALRGGRAVAGIGSIATLVPHVVPAQAGMALVVFGQGKQKLLRRPAQVVVVQAEPRRAARGAAPVHAGVQLAAVARLKAGVGIPAIGPLGGDGDHLGNDGFHAVLGRQVEVAVVFRPVIDARGDLDGRPQEPVTKEVHAVLSSGPVVALPVGLGRVGLAKIDCAIGEWG